LRELSAPFKGLFSFWRKKDINRSGRKELPYFRSRSLADAAAWQELTQVFSEYGYGSGLNALRVSAVFACSDRICKDIATLPVRPNRKTPSGQEIATDHYTYRLLRNPSDFLTDYTWLYVTNEHINLYGEAFSVLVRENGVPVAFQIVEPCDIDHQIVSNRLYWIHKKTKQVWHDSDMIHPMWFTKDGIRGESVLKYAKSIIDLAVNGQKLSSDLFRNQMWQPGYISYGGDLTSEQAEMIGKSWANNYMGEDNKENIPVLDQKSEYKQFGMSLKESEYGATIERTVIDICRYFGIPPSKVGIRNGNVSYNSLEQENIAYVQDTIMPRVVSLEKELERKLIADADAETIRIKFELKSRLRGDMAARSTFYDMALRSGLLSINDTLRLEDMDTIGPEGDERYVNSANVPVSKLFAGETDEPDPVENLIKQVSKNGHAKQILQ